jgi:uncharacterized membrane-anchored protein YitT (DUF2179 family)
MKIKAIIWDYLVITFAITIVAIAVFFFMMSGNVTIGSITGVAMVLSHFISLPVSILTMLMNVILLIVGFLAIGKEFGIKTVYTALMLPTLLWVLERIFPNNPSLTNDQTLDVICYCFLVSVGMAMLFVHNASSGGLDIVAKLMNKYLRIELGKAIAISGIVAALLSIFVYDTKTVILSVLGTYFNGIVVDHFIFGNTIKRRVCIISKKEKEILDFILYELHSGATNYHAYGAYTNELHTEIVTIVDKSEYLKLINFVTKTDPDAFVTVCSLNEIMYKPKVIEISKKE